MLKFSCNDHFSKRLLELLGIFCFCNTAEERQAVGSDIIDNFCKHFRIPKCKVLIYEKKRPKIKGRRTAGYLNNGWLCGYYTTFNKNNSVIEVWNKSENGRKLSWYIILSLLMHEFTHHYDVYKLKSDLKEAHANGFNDRYKEFLKIATLMKNKKGFNGKKKKE